MIILNDYGATVLFWIGAVRVDQAMVLMIGCIILLGRMLIYIICFMNLHITGTGNCFMSCLNASSSISLNRQKLIPVFFFGLGGFLVANLKVTALWSFYYVLSCLLVLDQVYLNCVYELLNQVYVLLHVLAAVRVGGIQILP